MKKKALYLLLFLVAMMTAVKALEVIYKQEFTGECPIRYCECKGIDIYNLYCLGPREYADLEFFDLPYR